ncbi:14-3-3 protein [Trichomonas vaginalis G3]|uniref:14-3-3 protein n=1 Tax=Trichomonas vaginalis (strain ATCC PRA-98 / G3) TaxID=412133 RepID=A2DKA1_TRIV3|nr:protein domain specific binding [Trichomonas vaginalis G3]EAY19078.1 14-3-3 protein [Trichomonas vaginalis G3]KAI5490378.1 protein domain specific binding [Trichomonas vaginalis G3]|eukprot:XP_001580064.1 14-3-3 protein [Trichomonas vaginalis G3]
MFEADNRVKMFLSRAIFEAGQVTDASKIVKSLAEANYPFTNEDKTLIVDIYEALVVPLRTAVMNIDNGLEPDSSVQSALQELKTLLLTGTDDIINIIQKNILPTCDTDESRANFLKAQADFQRYRVISLPAEKMAEAAEQSQQSYKKAQDVLNIMPNPPIDLSLKLQLNQAILLADFLGQKDKAIEDITQLRKDTSSSFEKYSDDIKPKINEIIDLMDENLSIWKNEE